MTPEHILRDKLRKIEALFAGAATPGEKAAAGAAAERIRERLGRTAGKEEPVELKFSISDIPRSRHDPKSFGLMTRKLSVTESQRSAQFPEPFHAEN